MLSNNEGAKAFRLKLAAQFALAVKTRRKALKLTASDVARRTSELGYPISRGAIAQIESNSRSGKVDVAELLTLAAALDIPPALLLFDGYHSKGLMELRPGFDVFIGDAVRWMLGQIAYPQRVLKYIMTPRLAEVIHEDAPRPPNDGVKLIAAATALDQITRDTMPVQKELHRAREAGGDVETAQRMWDLNLEKIAALRGQKKEAEAALWGTSRSSMNEADDAQNESDD